MFSVNYFWFSGTTDEMIEDSTKFYLETNARSQAAAFHAKLQSQVEILQLAGQVWETVDLTNYNAIAERLRKSGKTGTYTRVAVAGADGRMVDTNGVFMGDFSEAGYFKRVMSGETVISDVVHYSKEAGEYLYVAIPIMQKGKAAGVMYGQFPLAVLSDLIEVIGFQEASRSLLLSSDGTIIARSSGTELITDRIANFYDIGTRWGLKGKTTLTDIKVDVMSGRTITIPYQTGSRDRLAILTPVGLNNWYYAIVISQDVIHRQSKTLSLHMLVVMLAIIFAFALLLLTILHLLRQNALVEQTNDRFRMVTTQTQAIVFDYDFQKRFLVLNGNIKLISKDAKDTYTGDEIEQVLGNLLHESDRSVVDDCKALRQNTATSFLREMRLLCSDGNYYWHRLTGAVVRAEDGHPLRLVGNFVNVEDEVTKQQQLKQRAEIDPLSGLLNKGAFTSYVENLLAESTDESLYAFYIIDLDNFKQVNDTLGHIVGDHVITDVSQKLCTVFSENDFIGRIGGDEFAAFLKLSGSGKQMGRKIIEAKASAACAMINEIYSNGSHEVNITASIGVAIYPKDGKKFEDLYKNADSVLYKSKNGGKNQYNICG